MLSRKECLVLLKKALSALLILLILASIVAIVWFTVLPEKGEGFTEFYILGLDGKADNYPSQIKLGDNVTISMGIINKENKATSYRTTIQIEEVAIKEIWPIILPPNEKWEQQVSFIPTKVGDNQKIEFLLYNDDGTNAYLSLNLWIDVK
jgi:uncharacterized membrane protein